MFQTIPVFEENIFAYKITGKLTDADYQEFVPKLITLAHKYGPLSLLFELEDFHGWEPKAAWDDFKLGTEHEKDFRRIAIVGENRLEKWMTVLGDAFTKTQIRYFEYQDNQAAWDWLREPDNEMEPVKEKRPEIKPYSHVLAAIDFSSHSELTLQRALHISKQYDAKLSILYAIEHKSHYDRSYELMIDPEESFDTDEAVFEGVEKRLLDIKNETGRDNVHTEILWGRAKPTILSYAEAQQVDLIVMGSHGHHGLARLLGSTAHGVINNARCDVLVVRME